MSIDAIASSSCSPAASSQSGISQLKQDFQTLQSALGSGDIDQAKTAFTAVQKDLSQFQSSQKTTGGGTTSTNPVQQDLQALQDALNGGDLKGAQTAFAKFQSDIKSGKAHHGHHHHHQQDSTTSGSATTASNTSTSGSTGTLLNITA